MEIILSWKTRSLDEPLPFEFEMLTLVDHLLIVQLQGRISGAIPSFSSDVTRKVLCM